jgi:hypothetical protein
MIDYVRRLAGPFTGAGQSTFSFSFKIFDPTDVYVATALNDTDASTNLVYDTDYFVDMNEDQDATPGGTVTLAKALVGTQVVVIGSAIAYTQNVQLTNYSRFPPEIINEGLDRIVVQIQQLVEQTGRTLKVPATSSTTPEEMIASLLDAADTATVVAKGYAESAMASAQSAQGSAAEAQKYAEAAQAGAADILPYVDDLLTVADGISYVRTDAQNIDAIKGTAEHVNAVAIVAADFQTAEAHSNSHDFGYFNVDDVAPWTPGGGYIEIVAKNINAIKQAGGSIDAVNTVASNVTSVTTVGGSIAAVNTVAANIEAVKNAKANADAAASSASAAASSASAASGSASAAKTSETNAKKSETTASSAATVAGNAASSASASAQTASAASDAAGSAASTATEAASSATSSKNAAAASASAAATSATNAGTAKTAAEAAAARAEEAAGQATAGQAQADWAETDTTAKGFIKNKPETFPPSSHTHTVAQITNFPTTWAWNSISGKPSSFTPSAHTHAIADVTGLQTALDAKATTAALTTGLAGKAPTSHTHTVSQITDFPKTWAWASISGKPSLGTMAAANLDFGTWSAS